MARPTEEFLMAWLSLTGTAASSGWRAIGLPSAGPVGIQAGRRSPDDAEAVVFTFPSAKLGMTEKLPEGQGFIVERGYVDPDNPQLRLALTRRSSGTSDLFVAMVCDVVGALDDGVLAGANETRLLRVFIGRVNAWQEFMRKGSLALSPEAEIGLMGELMILGLLFDAGLPLAVALESWVGPMDAPQDFEIGTGALEVKATLSATGFPAKVGSLEQLDDAIRHPLFLSAVRLRQAEHGVTLPEKVIALLDVTREDPEALRMMGERLVAAGYFNSHSDRYVRRFSLVDTRIVEVKGGFPRLTPGSVPVGITRASYEINLNRASTGEISLTDVLRKAGAI